MTSAWGTVKIKKGDYKIKSAIEANLGQRVIVSGEEGAILVWEGPKHKPMFILESNSQMIVENLLIKYDGLQSEIAYVPLSAKFELSNSKIVKP